MKQLSLAALLAFAAATALAQAPAPVTTPGRTAQEANANKSGGMPAAKAEAKKDGTAMGASGTPVMSARMKAMDTNGDGMISADEYNAYHSGMWKKMKLKNGMASVADVEAMMSGGPN
ncbi:MAG: hypothetical protein HYX47_18420 [Burkholderiales bacterium]|nr:hypothetical protein [Burkholderiales bacterium]